MFESGTLTFLRGESLMPFGPLTGGFVYFAGVKFLGYTAYGQSLRKRFDDDALQNWSRTIKIGAVRTLIGVVLGAAYGALAWKGIFGDSAPAIFMIGLLPVRIGEWLLLLRLMFKERTRDTRQTAWGVGWGVIVSYGLDVIGIVAAFALPGGAWVC
jgi:hypothetical protein